MPLTHCSPYVDIAPDLISGEGCRVWSFAVICRGVRMGARCIIGSKVFLGVGVTLGDDVHIQDNAHITPGAIIGSRVFIGPLVVSGDDRHPRVNNPHYTREPPIIEDDVMVGAGAILYPGVRLGQGCQVAAGAVVLGHVAPGETVFGHPARRLLHPCGVPQSGLMDDLGIDVDLYARVCCAQEK